MVAAITSPPEWRRRATLLREGLPQKGLGSGGALGGGAAGGPVEGWPAPGEGSEPAELGEAGRAGLAALERGEDPRQLATWCRRVVWSQPEDLPGLLVVPADGHLGPGSVVAAHAGPQPFRLPGWAVAFLARAFAEHGRDDDLDAAAELHDLVVALGDDVWAVASAPLGWGAALLYEATGEQAFLATAERMADVLCEAGAALEGREAAEVAWLLEAMADAVEARAAAGIDAGPEADGGGEPGG